MTNSIPRRRRLRLPKPSLPPTLTGIIALLGLLPRISWKLTGLLAAGVVLASALPLSVTVAAGLLVGSVPEAIHNGLDSVPGRYTLRLLGVVILLIIAERLIGPFQTALAAVFGRRVDRYLQQRTMAAVGHPAGIGHLEEPAVLDLIESARGVGQQGLKPGDAVAALASLLPSWAQALGSAIILTTFRWWLGLVWLLLWPVLLYYLQREYVQVGQTRSGQAGALRRANYYRDLALQPAAAKEVRLWGLTDWLADRYAGAWRLAMEPLWRARRPGRAVLWLPTSTVIALNLLSLGLLASAAMRGDLALGMLVVYVQATLAASNFRAFDDANMILSHAAVNVPRVLALERRLDVEPTVGLPVPNDMPSTAIQFEGLEFRYVGTDNPVLCNLDLTLPAGRSLAIVGANGAGKTTIVKLLCRLYEPTKGRLTVDGTDLSQLEINGWRGRVTAIFQDFARYHVSARENIAIGAPHLAQNMEQLRAAAHRAGALELIEALPYGWDTVLSREYDGGVDLSGGQWQRIALARALLAVADGARVLILDEPTANLDIRAEAELYDRFLDLTAGLTTVLISHRFSTVRRADHIVVLEGGRVVESGDHSTLVAAGGRYATMFRVQAERFVEGAGKNARL